MPVDLILRRDVPALGHLGDIVSVASGYARNYLIPQGLAMSVSPANMKRIESDRKKAQKELEVELAELRVMAEKIRGASVTIAVRANEEGHLYGSVDARRIASAFEKDGLPIGASMFTLEEPIKELGVYPLEVTLKADVTTETKVWVVEDKDGETEMPNEDENEDA